MNIGGEKLVQLPLRKNENLVLESTYDIEEVSKYSNTLNPLNLFWRGSTFYVGHLFLTNQRLILLPYSGDEAKKAHLLQDIGYTVLDKAGLPIPKPEMNFSLEPLTILLREIHTINPFRKQFGIHPMLCVFVHRETYRFKFVPSESPHRWAEEVANLTTIEIKDVPP